MFEVQFDAARNLMSITYSGHVRPEEINAGMGRVQALLVDVKPGLRLLTDVSNLEKMDASCAEPIGLAMDIIKNAGVDFVVRIIPSPAQDIGFNILSIFHYDRSIRMAECSSLEEAESILG